MQTLFLGFNKQALLAQSLAQAAAGEFVCVPTIQHSSGEIQFNLPPNILYAYKQVIVVHSITNHDALIELMLLAHKLKSHNVTKITLIAPYIFYARLDKSYEFKAIIHMLESSGIDRIITLELHNPDTLSWFTVPVEHITLDNLIAEHIMHLNYKNNMCLVAPDHGGAQRVARIAKKLSLPIILCTKNRVDNSIHITLSEKNIDYSQALIIDDIIDTGNTIIAVSSGLRAAGVQFVSAFCVHPVFSVAPETITQNAQLASLVTLRDFDISLYLRSALEDIL